MRRAGVVERVCEMGRIGSIVAKASPLGLSLAASGATSIRGQFFAASHVPVRRTVGDRASIRTSMSPVAILDSRHRVEEDYGGR